ncbi:MAG: hypothetical protein NTU80_01565 [Verrucomicrobia bacterium]|nr:hypothetical protein [Verrucomicrobiota bacterium]
MLKLFILVFSTVLSGALGYGADAPGCDFFRSFIWSGVGAMAGCWLGWWLHRHFL